MEEHKKEKPDPSATPEQKENEKKDTLEIQPQKTKKERPEVITVRNWKEYLGESLLIIFSVILALFLTEKFTKLHEERQTEQVLHQLRDELISNKQSEEDQYQYHRKIMKNIDSALHNPGYTQKFIDNGEVHLSALIDSGVLKHDLNDVAWQVAKQNNVFAKLDLDTYRLLTDIYDNQQRISKS